MGLYYWVLMATVVIKTDEVLFPMLWLSSEAAACIKRREASAWAVVLSLVSIGGESFLFFWDRVKRLLRLASS